MNLFRVTVPMVALLAGAPAWAAPPVGPVFDWNPVTLGLDGGKFTADSILLSDYGRVVVDPATGAFTDTGVMPILGFTLGGQAVAAPGYLDPSGQGWGAYVTYEGTGFQQPQADGSVLATYTALTYSIVGYNGLASFGLGPSGIPYVRGGTDAVVLGQGGLIQGSLVMTPVGFEDGVPVVTVAGEVDATIDGVPKPFSSNTMLGFSLDLEHAPGSFMPVSPTEFWAVGGTGSTATLLAGKGQSGLQAAAVKGPGGKANAFAAEALETTAVPEPASAALVAVGLGVLGLVRRRRA